MKGCPLDRVHDDARFRQALTWVKVLPSLDGNPSFENCSGRNFRPFQIEKKNPIFFSASRPNSAPKN